MFLLYIAMAVWFGKCGSHIEAFITSLSSEI